MKLIIRTIFLLTIYLSFNNSLKAQRQNNIWYFGNGAGLDFNTGKPVALKNGELFTEEGCATISDQSGKLLFYTNGVKIWDADHKVMNGNHPLSGDISTTQSVLIVPSPSEKNIYYIFTADEKAGSKGLSYSIVDMTKRAGKGGLIKGSKFLYGPISEKLTLTPHINGKDYWIIVHQWNSNTFASFLVTEKGVSKTPVLSKVGKKHTGYGSKVKSESIGQMKISPNGKILASVMCYIPNNPIEFFDFNNATGEITNQREIPTSGYAYGVEFSPDNSKLYVSFLKGAVGIIQYDLNSTNIFESGYILSKSTKTSVFGGIQLGPDNNIFIAKTGHSLDVITNPNAKQTNCGYRVGGINLGDRYCVYGLPSVVNINNAKSEAVAANDGVSIINNNGNESSRGALCSEYVELDAGHSGSVFLWSTGETTQIISARTMGSYTVKISDPENISSQSVNFMVNKGEPKVDLKGDTSLFCIKKYVLDAKHKGYQYKWSTGETKQKIEVNRSGKYSVTVTNGGCWDRDTVYVTFDSKPPKFKALTSFSPANNGFNNQFDYTVGDVFEFYLEVKTTKGKLVWKTTSSKEIWSGKDKKGEKVNKGSYNWKVRYKGICTFGETIEEEGTVRIF
ncbi:MAG: gliding motility-associated C-terminal domain-containing protein [Flavobacteriales bacterium]|nr:gliding motility-associated C-terminal domain-containing protein [Flavobacteriales bacterium]